jgi:hypothetical protein
MWTSIIWLAKGFGELLLNKIKHPVLRKGGNFLTIYLHVRSQEKLPQCSWSSADAKIS